MSRNRTRSRASQFTYAITQNVKVGVSKRAENRNPNIDNSATLYSVGDTSRTKAIRETANQLSKFLDEKYPHEGKMVNQITREQVQEFVDFKAKTNNLNSMREIVGRINKLDKIVQSTFDGGGFTKGLEIPLLERADKVRDRSMSREHVELLREEMKGSRSQGVKALEIATRCGLRSKEIERLHSSRIDLDNSLLWVREGAKNGKHRPVPIRAADLPYFEKLKAETAGGYVCNGVKAQSLNDSLRRYMGKIPIGEGRTLAEEYPKSTIHAIRKLYAHERMQEERGQPEPLEEKKDEMRAWDIVSQEMGHGKNREDLYSTYVG